MSLRCSSAALQPPRDHAKGRQLLLCAGIALALGGWVSAHATDASTSADASGADASFDRSLLSGAGQNTVDLSRFEHGNPISPGNYRADLYLNGMPTGRANVRFATAPGQVTATPCVDQTLLDKLNLRPSNLPAEVVAQMKDPAACVGFDRVIPGANLAFDLSSLRLDASVPQALLGLKPRGYVGPEYWDAGVPAALLNYNFNTYRSSNQGISQTTAYLGLNLGLNIGSWHFRQDSTANWFSSEAGAPARHQWQNINTYVQRDLPSLRAQLTLGDSFTDGQVFDSYGLRGVQLATDDRMLPDSLRGYAPVVRGVADTNAKVTVRQNGLIIYQTTVAPGPFSINDLYPTGYGGNLDVTISEADGRTRTFVVPYASVAQLLRPGTTRFDIGVGELRSTLIDHKPTVAQATVQHGFGNLWTGYAGLQASQGYQAVLIGSALNSRFGAVSIDLTQAHAEIPGFSSQSGQSMRISYSKILPETNTSLSVAAYRYSTSGFLSLSDAAVARDYSRRGLDAFTATLPINQTFIDGIPAQNLLTPAQQAALNGANYNPALQSQVLQRQRNRFTLSLSQRLGDSSGSLFLNTTANDYWNRTGTDTQFQVGYNNTFHQVNYGVSATRTRDPVGRYDNQYFVNLSFPLGQSTHSPTLSFNASHDTTSGAQEQAMISGSAGVDNQFTYGATASHNETTGNAGSLNGGYRSPYAIINASYGNGSGFSQAAVNVSGAVVAHPGGLTFGQPMGDTVGLVHIPDAAGARLGNASGLRVDGAGYALVPYLVPYNLNTITVDPHGLPLDVELDSTSAQIAPHAGAVVMVTFTSHNGRVLIAQVRLQDGKSLPFGAEIVNEKGTVLGVSGQAGKVLMRGVEQRGLLTARWNNGEGMQSCQFPYQLSPRRKGQLAGAFEQITVTCLRSTSVAQVSGSGT
ncbi:fimbrial biogenesis outer membrane usher protein [Dyella solisilvae]|uniref:Fimbrial biogenesis outer membrane usher protein n=1 Tax=Dyella solisilvae TaxID=1920168 RepID=A0A370K5C6_9GAMM|nr:fimbria/pilus outer membrane usher protein [Dyella solisilvae]RDI97220.1 fimbrial biogenesis outer membrane usher protein [Dyella solisilvae]